MNQKSYPQKIQEKTRQKNKVSQTNNKKCKKKAIDSINLVKKPKGIYNKEKDDHLIIFKKTETTQRSLEKSKEKGRSKGCKTKEISNDFKYIRPKTSREGYINHSLSKSKSKSKSPTTKRKNTGNLTERKVKKDKKAQSPIKKLKISKQLFATPQKSNQKFQKQKRQSTKLIYTEESDESLTQYGQNKLQNEQKQQIFVKIDQSKVKQQSNDNQISNKNIKKPLKQIKTTISTRKRSIIDEILLQKIQEKKIGNKHQFSIQSRLLSSINDEEQKLKKFKRKIIDNNNQRDEINRFKQQQQNKWKKMLEEIKRLKDSGNIQKNIDSLIKQITLNANQLQLQGIKKMVQTKQINQEEPPKCSQNTLTEYSLSANQNNMKLEFNRQNVSAQRQQQKLQGINKRAFVNNDYMFQDTELVSIQAIKCMDELTINQQPQKLRSNGISLNDFFIQNKKSFLQLKQDLYEPRKALNRLELELTNQSKLQVKLPPPIMKPLKYLDIAKPQPIYPEKINNEDIQLDRIQEKNINIQQKNKEQQKGSLENKAIIKIQISLDKYEQKQSTPSENCLKISQTKRQSQNHSFFQKIADENLYQNITCAITQCLLVQFSHKILQNEKLLHFLLTNYKQYDKINQQQHIYHEKPMQPSTNQYAFWLMHRLLDYLINKHNDYLCQQVAFYYQCKPIDVLKYVRSGEDSENDEDSYDIENDQLIQIPFFNLEKVYTFQTQQLENIHYLPSYFSFNQCIYDTLNDIVDRIRPFGNKGKSIFSIELSHPIKGAQKIKKSILSQFTNIFNDPNDTQMIKDNLVHGQEGNFQIIYFVALQVAEAIYNQSVYQIFNVYKKKTFQQ